MDVPEISRAPEVRTSLAVGVGISGGGARGGHGMSAPRLWCVCGGRSGQNLDLGHQAYLYLVHVLLFHRVERWRRQHL